jgi:DNA-binding helix-hairpin-helix protein with protein kinase domain
VDQPPLREGRVVRTWIAALGEEVVLYEVDLPACCRRSAVGSGDTFECPSCGAVWQAPLPVEAEEDAFGQRDTEERKGAA